MFAFGTGLKVIRFGSNDGLLHNGIFMKKHNTIRYAWGKDERGHFLCLTYDINVINSRNNDKLLDYSAERTFLLSPTTVEQDRPTLINVIGNLMEESESICQSHSKVPVANYYEIDGDKTADDIFNKLKEKGLYL
ncbi:MAG: hypothetical protein JST50_23130 [Bacteroidetes bacterium]|jgi:hypothetical protein|nr:hypothetical protein [Bacteroidota bacterium]